jgi:polysaccharide pyruvyl transferase WcaK-like protein
MKIYFAPDTSDHPNWGCRVMGDWFRSEFARAGYPPRWCTGSRWFYRQHPQLPRLRTMADFRHHANEIKAGRILVDLAAVLRECDLVFLNGENFIRPGAHKGRMLLFIAYLTRTVFHKPCVLSNHSVDLDEADLAEIAGEIYPLLDEVHFREETSLERGASLVAPGRSRLIPDVAWALPAAPLAEWAALARRPGHFSAWPDSAENFDPLRPYITVCASSIFSAPGHQEVDIAPAFVKLCKRLNEEVAPVLLTAPCVAEHKIMRKVHSVCGLPLLGANIPVRQAIDVIGNAAVHVGGRWHLGIFAASGGTPTVALSANTHKMHSLMRQLQMGDPVFDALQVEQHIDAIVSLAARHMEAGTPLRDRILHRSRELGAQVGRNMDFVRRQAESMG